MGAWGYSSFENDTALDCIEEWKDVSAIRRLLEGAANSAAELDADEASCLLAAAEVVCTMMGRTAADFPEDALDNWKAAGDPDEALRTMATVGVERVRDNSELAELWAEEPSENKKWQKEIKALLKRLDPEQPYRKPRNKKKDALPDDFLGYCMICNGMVTERDGYNFVVDMGGPKMTVFPHRACVQEKCDERAWNEDGTPTEAGTKTLRKLMGL